MDQQPAKPISSYSELDAAMIEIHREYNDIHPEDRYVEVTDVFFKALTKGQKTSYLTYGMPGIKIYRAGTKAECDADDNLPADEARIKEIKERQAEAAKKRRV